MATLVVIRMYSYKMLVYLEPNLCVKFALKFSISLKIAILRKNPGGLANFFPTGGAGCLGGARRWTKFNFKFLRSCLIYSVYESTE